MVATLNVTIEGLDQLSENLTGRIPKKIALGLAEVANGLRAVLGTAVDNRYQLTAETGNLDSVLVGRTIIRVKQGKSFIRTGLTYRFKFIPLSKFSVKEVRVSARAKFGVVKPDGSFRFVEKNYALATRVKVLRKSGFITVRGKRGFGGFLIKPTRAKSNNPQRRGIFERKQRATFLNPANPVDRAPIEALFGPSLSQMAGVVLKTDSKVQRYLDTAADIIVKELIK